MVPIFGSSPEPSALRWLSSGLSWVFQKTIPTLVENKTRANAEKLDACSRQNQPEAVAMPNTVRHPRQVSLYSVADKSSK